MSLITEIQELRRQNRQLTETVRQQDLKISELERALTDAVGRPRWPSRLATGP